ncbi:chorismate-binding protein [Janibacter sp. G1551]|uniref:chorismate-binding protein n=1 Tax=Janibacter sp. G1551 TaxID=3420440 RepID=UPI003D02DF90
MDTGRAQFGQRVLTGVAAITHDPADVQSGSWAVVATFEGEFTAVRFTRTEVLPDSRADTEARGDVRAETPETPETPAWPGLDGPWRTSLDRAAYTAGVERIREHIADGSVYQVNLCRVLEHDLPPGADLDGLAARLRAGNPAPFAGRIVVPEAGLDVVCASPEAYLRRDGERIVSSPIKGTAPTLAEMLPKDVAENVMIADLIRNDLSRVCEPGTVAVERLCAPEEHPGLVHLVTDVAGRLRAGTTWADVFAATFPPGSVSGAPKSSALRIIGDLEPAPRGPYCGAIGWIDADAGTAELAVGIRTFWSTDGPSGRVLRFGTGAGITWGSDPGGEWSETELKAARLIRLASEKVAS